MYDIGMRVVAMSNNHAYDKGAEGIAATCRFWASMPDDMVTTGLWEGEADYQRIPIQEQNGVKIAWLAYTRNQRTACPHRRGQKRILSNSPRGCYPAPDRAGTPAGGCCCRVRALGNGKQPYGK